MAQITDLGIISYKSVNSLGVTLGSIRASSVSPLRISVFHNPSPGDEALIEFLEKAKSDGGITNLIVSPTNVGYAGAMNNLLRLCLPLPDFSNFLYCDNDVEIKTRGWDQQLLSLLENSDLGMVYPNGGINPIPQTNYHECMWGIGCCFMVKRAVIEKVGMFDEALGHQEEADYALRVRMAGWRLAHSPITQVLHLCAATQSEDPESVKRIGDGIFNFVNKWNCYFCGEGVTYHSPNVLRWEDWPPNALYMERWLKQTVGLKLNDKPEVIRIGNFEYDLIRVPRRKDFYRGRII